MVPSYNKKELEKKLAYVFKRIFKEISLYHIGLQCYSRSQDAEAETKHLSLWLIHPTQKEKVLPLLLQEKPQQNL